MNLIFCALWVYSNSSVRMNVLKLRAFLIRSARIRVKQCETDFRDTLQSDHRYSGSRHASTGTAGSDSPPEFHAVARNSSCTLGQGSGARFLNGAQSLSVMRSKIAALTEGRARMRAHQSAMAGYCAQRPWSLSS